MSARSPKHSHYPAPLAPMYNNHDPIAGDEISLVELAKVVVQRRWWVVGTAGFIFLLTLVYGLFTRAEPNYPLTSVYETAQRTSEAGNPAPMQSAGALIRRLETIHWPALTRDFLAANPEYDSMPFDVSIASPADTQLIVLRTQAPEAEQASVENLHQQLVDHLVILDEERLEQLGAVLESRLARIESALDRIQNQSNEGAQLTPFFNERLISLGEQQGNLQMQLDGLRQGNVLQVAAAGERISQGPGLALIVALGAVLGGFIGLLAAFFVEFSARVRKSLADEVAENSRSQQSTTANH